MSACVCVVVVVLFLLLPLLILLVTVGIRFSCFILEGGVEWRMTNALT